MQVARSLATLSRVELGSGNAPAAQEVCRQALAMRFRLVSDRHPEISQNLKELADVVEVVGGLTLDEGDLSPDGNPLQDAPKLRTLGHVLGNREPMAASTQVWQDLLEVKRHLLGREHGDTAETLVAWGRSLLSHNESARALLCFEEALSIYTRDYGEDHTVIADCLSHVGEALQLQGRFDDALPVRARRYEIYRDRMTGKDDMAVAVTQQELARLFEKLEDVTAAELHYRGAIAHLESTLGPETRHIALIACQLAEVLRRAGRFAEAESWARRSVELRTQLDATPDAWLISFRGTLAATLSAQEKFEEAEKILLSNLSSLDAMQQDPRNEQLLKECCDALLAIYDASGRPEKADAIRSIVLARASDEAVESP